MSEENRFAFKEWKLVCDAIQRGQQCVLLRKGGISEGKLGFQWLHSQFFLFPTWFHTQSEQVRFPLPDGFEEGKEPDSVTIRLWAETVRVGTIRKLEAVAPLREFHGWTEEVVAERFSWGDEPAISVAVIRAWQLAKPWTLPMRSSFGGCRSWLGMPISEGLPPSWKESMSPVTSDEMVAEAERRLAALDD